MQRRYRGLCFRCARRALPGHRLRWQQTQACPRDRRRSKRQSAPWMSGFLCLPTGKKHGSGHWHEQNRSLALVLCTWRKVTTNLERKLTNSALVCTCNSHEPFSRQSIRQMASVKIAELHDAEGKGDEVLKRPSSLVLLHSGAPHFFHRSYLMWQMWLELSMTVSAKSAR